MGIMEEIEALPEARWADQVYNTALRADRMTRIRTVEGITEKYCVKCRVWKNERNNFYPRRCAVNKRNTTQTFCKCCQASYVKRHKAKAKAK